MEPMIGYILTLILNFNAMENMNNLNVRELNIRELIHIDGGFKIMYPG